MQKTKKEGETALKKLAARNSDELRKTQTSALGEINARVTEINRSLEKSKKDYDKNHATQVRTVKPVVLSTISKTISEEKTAVEARVLTAMSKERPAIEAKVLATLN